jgi:hypothetical protein
VFLTAAVGAIGIVVAYLLKTMEGAFPCQPFGARTGSHMRFALRFLGKEVAPPYRPPFLPLSPAADFAGITPKGPTGTSGPPPSIGVTRYR